MIGCILVITGLFLLPFVAGFIISAYENKKQEEAFWAEYSRK